MVCKTVEQLKSESTYLAAQKELDTQKIAVAIQAAELKKKNKSFSKRRLRFLSRCTMSLTDGTMTLCRRRRIDIKKEAVYR